MRQTRRGLLAAAIGNTLAARSGAQPPAPFGPVPSPRQLAWHRMEVYGFVHFTINTFTGKEWGYGDEDPRLFDPRQFDAGRIARALQAGGLKGLILTCKHHDGFCLWPTRTTAHSIRNSPWRAGQGDMVREMAGAARRSGLEFGVYVSPWDRNHARYAHPEYVRAYHEQIRELLTGYGPMFEIWHDGANGGDGYYGGAREKRTIAPDYYQWGELIRMERSLQPGAVLFGTPDPDVRWVGNERGVADETCWAAMRPGDRSARGAGHRDGSLWSPAECDVSIRPGWFWHEEQNDKVKTPAELLSLYYQSVGRGASLLLNVPPDRRGLVHERDRASLEGFARLVRLTFETNVAAKTRIAASNVRANHPRFDPRHLLDGDPETYWACDDAVTTPQLILESGRRVRFNVVRLREHLRLGQRVDAFELDCWQEPRWQTVARGASIGACRLVRLPAAVTTTRVRLRITRAAACPALSEFGLYLEPFSEPRT